jgi:hypothetical protein
MSVRSGFLLAKEKSPDRRVPGLALSSKEKPEIGGARRKTNYAIPRTLPPNPMGGLTGDVVVTLHGGRPPREQSRCSRHYEALVD